VAGALVVGGVVWVLVNQPVEGPVLLSFTPDHGLTVADLFSIAAFIIALVLVLPTRGGRP
jgi:hypothetical protein